MSDWPRSKRSAEPSVNKAVQKWAQFMLVEAQIHIVYFGRQFTKMEQNYNGKILCQSFIYSNLSQEGH